MSFIDKADWQYDSALESYCEIKPANILQAFFLLFSKVFPYQEF